MAGSDRIKDLCVSLSVVNGSQLYLLGHGVEETSGSEHDMWRGESGEVKMN